MTAAADHLHRNPWLDLCRALAILLVLLSHGRVFVRGVLPWTDALRFGGFLGVELFFVLSGFLIGGILIRLARQGGHWLGGFYARRWLRTLPNYYLFLALNILLVWLAIRPGNVGDAWRYALFIQNLASAPPLFFQEAWSLAVEEVFYLLFPALFLTVARLLGQPAARAILPTALAVIVASLVARLLVADTIQSWDDDLRKVVFLRFDTLMFGVLLAWLHDRGHPLLRRRALVAAAVLLFVACAVYFARRPDAALNASFFAKTAFLSLASLGCAGVVVAGLAWSPPRPLAAVGGFLARVSYSAYLTNLPVAMLLAHYLPCCDNGLAGSLAMWLAFMALSLGSAHLLYRWYERYFNRLRDRLFPA